MAPMLDLNFVLKNDSSPEATVESLLEFWNKALFNPWQEVSNRPSKAIRGQFVQLGWHLAGSPALTNSETLLKISEIIETIHLGSLIIDDIQDNSLERRGGPTLHQMHGVPLALNLGNFLYFQALSQITSLDVSADYKNAAMKQITLTLRDAHLGQALDVSVPIDQVERQTIPKLVETNLRLKSGALMKLSVHLGALLNPHFKNWEALHCFGESYGSCLQKFDDIGNFTIKPECKKNLEDLMLRRPTWIWSVFSQHASISEWSEFYQAVQALPATEKLASFLKTSALKQKAYSLAVEDLHQNMEVLRDQFSLHESSVAFQMANQLTERLCHAY